MTDFIIWSLILATAGEAIVIHHLYLLARDQKKPIEDDTKCTLLAIPDAGVQFVSESVYQWACWRRPDGRAQCSRVRAGACP